MKEKINYKKAAGKITGNEKEDNSQDYPVYPDSEDVYSKFIEEEELNPEDISKLKVFENKEDVMDSIDKDYYGDEDGSDLDVPGSELDDEQEEIGNEDEENNYYSLGGDNHNNLDEDKDDL